MLATELSSLGTILDTDRLKLVHVQLPAGKHIPAHDHPGADIFFTLVRGQVKTLLNDHEEHSLLPGTVLQFAGETMIRIEALADSEFFVYLVSR